MAGLAEHRADTAHLEHQPGLAAASIFTFVASRQIITGLTAGAVKG